MTDRPKPVDEIEREHPDAGPTTHFINWLKNVKKDPRAIYEGFIAFNRKLLSSDKRSEGT